MGSFYDKQHASRIIKSQGIDWPGAGTVSSTRFLAETWQIRVVTQLAGYISIVPTTADATVATTAGAGAYLPANLPEYFAVSPGMILSYASSTTSTLPVPIVNVTEMS